MNKETNNSLDIKMDMRNIAKIILNDNMSEITDDHIKSIDYLEDWIIDAMIIFHEHMNEIKDMDRFMVELLYQRSLIRYRKLEKIETPNKEILLEKENLLSSIIEYEKKFWNHVDNVSKEQIKESDIAEKLAQTENKNN